MKILFKLFVVFAKIGLFTLGGGYAMIPLMERELVNTYLTKEDFWNSAIELCIKDVEEFLALTNE